MGNAEAGLRWQSQPTTAVSVGVVLALKKLCQRDEQKKDRKCRGTPCEAHSPAVPTLVLLPEHYAERHLLNDGLQNTEVLGPYHRGGGEGVSDPWPWTAGP